jgi:hypothetical protein
LFAVSLPLLTTGGRVLQTKVEDSSHSVYRSVPAESAASMSSEQVCHSPLGCTTTCRGPSPSSNPPTAPFVSHSDPFSGGSCRKTVFDPRSGINTSSP